MTLVRDKPYDIIVAGAGPAGCVLASRLSEDPQNDILLIEAGPDAVPGEEHPDVVDPFPRSSSNPDLMWKGLVADIDAGEGVLRRRRCAKGLGIGGGSNVNGMGADRGCPDDYRHWGALGAAGWDWEEVLPYFRRMETDLDYSVADAAGSHGFDGPMPVRRLPRSRWAPFTAAVGEALERRGFPILDDYLTDFRDGLASVPTNSLERGRVSASMAYLTPDVRRRPNLTILTDTSVDRVALRGKCATGVFLRSAGVETRVDAKKVILACGAIQSPAVLMRSGIGPAGHLRSMGIEVVADRKGVGANLQNHPCLMLTTYLPRRASQADDNPWFLQNWLRFSSRFPDCGEGDMHLMQFNRMAWHALGARVGATAVTVLQPFSKGSVRLATADPATPPSITFNLFGDSRDFERLVQGTRFMLEILSDPEVATMHRQLFQPDDRIVASLNAKSNWNALRARALGWALDIPAVRALLLARSRIDPKLLLHDEGALRDFVRQRAHPQAHDCGTCRMGAADDPGAVVDGIGTVRGVEGLSVVDASIFPTIPRGYPHFIVIMTAEKIADAIRPLPPTSLRVRRRRPPSLIERTDR